MRGAHNDWMMRQLHQPELRTTHRTEVETAAEDSLRCAALDAARAADQARYRLRKRRFERADSVVLGLLTPRYDVLTGLIFAVAMAAFFLTRTSSIEWRILQTILLESALIVLVSLFPVLNSDRRVLLHSGLWKRYQHWKAHRWGITDADWPDPRRRRSPRGHARRKKRR